MLHKGRHGAVSAVRRGKFIWWGMVAVWQKCSDVRASPVKKPWRSQWIWVAWQEAILCTTTA